jgi:hypothetical protein
MLHFRNVVLRIGKFFAITGIGISVKTGREAGSCKVRELEVLEGGEFFPGLDCV